MHVLKQGLAISGLWAKFSQLLPVFCTACVSYFQSSLEVYKLTSDVANLKKLFINVEKKILIGLEENKQTVPPVFLSQVLDTNIPCV